MWQRYEDNIFVMWRGTERQLENFHSYINTLHSRIKYTIEKEINGTLKFLHLKQTKEKGRIK